MNRKIMNRKIRTLVALSCMCVLFGCGGGGDGGAGGGKVGADLGSAVIKLSTRGTLPEGSAIAGIGVTVNLPAGMTVVTDTSGKVATGVVTGSGVTEGKATILEPDYVAPAATAPAKISFVLAGTDAAGFGTGEFATVRCAVAAGVTPAPTDISLSDFKPVDLRGGAITGLSATHTAEFQLK